MIEKTIFFKSVVGTFRTHAVPHVLNISNAGEEQGAQEEVDGRSERRCARKAQVEKVRKGKPVDNHFKYIEWEAVEECGGGRHRER